MGNKEILTKVIEKAVKSGWITKKVWQDPCNIEIWTSNNMFYDIIFSHDFAKAFWGEDILEIWQYHLQQMVLELQPLKYLERFL